MNVTYRIIPHASVLNSASRNFQRALYDLLSVNAADFITWEFRVSTISIEFRVTMPESIAPTFRVKFRNHEQWRRSTLEEVEPEPSESAAPIDMDTYALRYYRADMFALDYRYNEQQTPIREVLGIVDELDDGESFVISVKQRAVDRMRWKQLADYAWSTWDRGGVPYRSGLDVRRMARAIGNGLIYGMYEVQSLLNDILYGIERTFFKSDTPRQKPERPAFANSERAELLVNGDLSPTTRNKRNQPAFKTWINFAVQSPDSVKRDVLAQSIAGAYGSMAGDNRLVPVRVNIRSRAAVKLAEWTPNIMSADELGKLTQLPTAELQAEHSGRLSSNQRVEIELPAVFLEPSGILAGTATDRGAEHNVHIPTKDPDFLYTPRIVNGSPRMGKDQHVINLVVEAKRKHGIGAVIIDVIDERNGHRGMSDAVRDHIPAADVIDIDLGDTENPVYLGLDSVMRGLTDKRIAADRIAEEISAFLLADGDSEHLQTADYLREAAKVTGGDILAIKHMFTSKVYRNEMIAKYDDIFDVDIWRDYDKMSDGMQAQKYAPVARRIGQIMNSEFLRPLFCQSPDTRVDLFRWISEGKVVIFRLPTGKISERAVQVIAYWLTLNVFLAKIALGGRGAGTYLVLNEPHQFLSDGLVHFMERMLSEGPKYRLAPVIIFHHFAQFKRYSGFVDMMMAASANWHIFKNTNHGVYERLMPYLTRTFTNAQQAFEATKRFQFIGVWLNAAGEYEAPFVSDALPMVGARYKSEPDICRGEGYGRPITEVLADIKRRNAVAR